MRAAPKPDPTDPTISQRYYAYGRERVGKVSDLPTDYAFTGQKQDSTGLMYFNARYFDPQIGAFISPDTLIPTPTDLYSYNRYMAFRGNPMRYTDPTGHCIFGIDTAICIGVAIGMLAGGAIGGGWFYANEQYQQDGFSWNDDWKDLATASGLGALGGAFIGAGGAIAAGAVALGEAGLSLATIGTGMVSNQVTNLALDSLTGSDFNRYEYGAASLAGAAASIAGPAIGTAVSKMPSIASKGPLLAKAAGTLADGLSQGAIMSAGSYLSNAFSGAVGDWNSMPNDLGTNLAGAGMGLAQDFGPTSGWSGLAWQTFIGVSSNFITSSFGELFSVASCGGTSECMQ